MINNENYYNIPVPEDLGSIIAVHDGTRWINGVIPGTVSVNNGVVSLTVRWQGSKRRFTLATDLIGGYQTEE